MKHSTKPWVADLTLLLVTAIWGSTFVIVKEAVADFPLFSFLSLRFCIASISLLVLGRRREWLRRDVWRAGGLAGVFLAGGFILQTLGLMSTTPAKAGFITGMSVVMVPLFLGISKRSWPALPVMIGAVLAAGGLAFLSLGPELVLNPGDILVLLSAVCFALQIITVGRHASSIPTTALTGVQLSVVAALCAIFALFEQRPPMMPAATLNGLLMTAIPATSLAFLLQSRAQRFTSASHTALIFSVEPVFAALFAYILVGERLGAHGLLGSVLILGGLLLAELGPMLFHSVSEGNAPAS